MAVKIKASRLLKELAGADPARVRVVELRRNFGQTAALAAGIDHAQGSIIVMLDADMQNDPADIPMMLEKIDEGYDVVSGWRKERKDTFINRTLPSKIANGLISWVTGVHLHDYGCTLKAYRREVITGFQAYMGKCTVLFQFMPIGLVPGSLKYLFSIIRVSLEKRSTDWRELSKSCWTYLQLNFSSVIPVNQFIYLVELELV